MATKKLSEYLERLSTDADALERFKRGKTSARREMQAAGLNDDQVKAMLSEDSEQVRVQLIAEVGDLGGGGQQPIRQYTPPIWLKPDPDE